MSILSREIDDDNGRYGSLNFESKTIVTPNYIPTGAEYYYLQQCSCLSPRDYSNTNSCEIVRRLDFDQLTRFGKQKEYLDTYKNSIKKYFSDVNRSIRMLHFNFYRNISKLDARQLEMLLQLQYDVGVDVIEIPNYPGWTWDYSNIIKFSRDWADRNEIDLPLLAVASSVTDVDIVNSNAASVDGMGVNLSPFKKQVLFKVRRTAKNADLWLHAFNTPREYPAVDKQGTLGILINFFGFDTASTRVAGWKETRGFYGSLAEKSQEDLLDAAQNMRYFNPGDYSTHSYSHIQEIHGDECHLSSFCDCPICRSHKIEDLVEGYEFSYQKTRAHQTISYLNEASNVQDHLINNNSEDYINSKEYVKKIISSYVG